MLPYLYAFIFSLCSIIYELALARMMQSLSGSGMLWYCVTIGCFICSMGFGTLFYSYFDKKWSSLRILISSELLLTFFGAASMLAIISLHTLYRIEIHNMSSIPAPAPAFMAAFLNQKEQMFSLFAILTQIFTIIIGFLSGCEIPAIHKSFSKTSLNKLLATSYIGSLAGTLLFAFVALPGFGMILTAICTATLNLALASLLLFHEKRRQIFLIPHALLILFIGASLFLARPIEQLNLKAFYFLRSHEIQEKITWAEFVDFSQNLPDIERTSSYGQIIDKVYEYTETHGESLRVYINGHYQFSSTNEKIYHEAMSHIPQALTGKNLQNVLVLGAGDGLLIRELLKYPSIDQITHIEIDANMLRFASFDKDFARLNENSLTNSRVRTVIDDAFHFLRTDAGKYDAIYVDFPYPYSLDVAKLYSMEFYGLTRKVLKPNGFLAMDAPLIPDSLKVLEPRYLGLNSLVFNSLEAAGYKSILPFLVQQEGFYVATLGHEPWSRDGLHDHPHIKSIPSAELAQVGHQPIGIERNKKWVNSIFKPQITLLKDRSF